MQIDKKFEGLYNKLLELSDEEYNERINRILSTSEDNPDSDEVLKFVMSVRTYLEHDRFIYQQNKKLEQKGLKLVSVETTDPTTGVESINVKLEKLEDIDHMTTGLTEQEKESLLKFLLTSGEITYQETPDSHTTIIDIHAESNRFTEPIFKLVIKAMDNLRNSALGFETKE